MVTSLKLVNALADTAFVTVTIPAEIADTFKFVPKLIVPAVPTRLPPSLTITPAPDQVTPLSPDPSPTKFVAVTTPVLLEPPSVGIVVVLIPILVTFVSPVSAILLFDYLFE